MLAHLAWQLDVWGLQSLHWQGHPRAGQLPFLFFSFFFWVTGELPILRQQEAAADARRT